MTLGCPLEKNRYETSLLCVPVHGSSASVMFYRTLSKSIWCNKIIYGFSKPFCPACNFSCGVLGEHVSGGTKCGLFSSRRRSYAISEATVLRRWKSEEWNKKKLALEAFVLVLWCVWLSLPLPLHSDGCTQAGFHSCVDIFDCDLPAERWGAHHWKYLTYPLVLGQVGIGKGEKKGERSSKQNTLLEAGRLFCPPLLFKSAAEYQRSWKLSLEKLFCKNLGEGEEDKI